MKRPRLAPSAGAGDASVMRAWRRFSCTLALAAGSLAASGCVRPWERGALSHRSLDPDKVDEAWAEDFCSHVYDVREGATGGLGRPGGGCGCN